jgi:hypothetical protein
MSEMSIMIMNKAIRLLLKDNSDPEGIVSVIIMFGGIQPVLRK